ncbi:endonuclease/exonuclease/phosphatase family protein [Nocardioides campestrisoli]|uniref:endonuclease/exonuclease/phosphatase family protein n=1 Tax=Nocardioides campestrisoli TaxID=2736757 RepID=UPI00163DA537|nr:endonuclease/exonuclease/phosphatase family protein [Nocardioides campestrisoli]
MRRLTALTVPSSLLAAGALLCAGAGVLAPSASATGPGDRPAHGKHGHGHGHGKGHGHGQPGVRFATYNASLNRATAGQLIADLATGTNAQARAVAEVVQRTRPDVLLVNEFDHDDQGRAARLFRDLYLGVGQGGARGIEYPYWYAAPSNTGVPSGLDLDNDGTVGGGNDAFGFGEFPGQYGMVVYSRHPIQERQVRTFQRFRWADMPGARLPDDPATPEPADWYSPAELAQVRLSSKSHWDVPIRVGRRTVHLLASHPTPPTFDGPEDRNGTRNADEIRFWADYVTGGRTARYVYDDRGRRGGLAPRSAFVVAGDLNSDPYDGDSVPGAVQQILEHPAVDATPVPTSAGAVEASRLQGGANATHRGPASSDTADFADGAPGNLRADYVLPGGGAQGERSGVFWPTLADPLSRLTGVFPFPTSDHRLVWVDVRLR